MVEQFATIFHAYWYMVTSMNYFTRHLHSVDETYGQHFRHALGFAVSMFLGSLYCLVHALLPFLFERAGSDVIRRLHERMVVNRHKLTPRPGAPLGSAHESAVAAQR